MNNGLMMRWAICILAALTLSACSEKARGPSTNTSPATAEDRRTQGDTLLKQMSEKLQSAQAITFSTTETIERVRRNNEKVQVSLNRQVAVRRPNRLWFKTTGDHDLESFYDGKDVTIVSHKEKVFGQFSALPTLDETADLIATRYDIPLPIADLLSSSPHETLLDDKTTGGWEKRETIEGVECNVVTYQHPNVAFSVWIPVSGDPLPRKLVINYKTRRGQPATSILFKDWNLSPQMNDEMFARKVPEDYEGIPVVQRASAVIQQAEVNAADKNKTQTPTPATKQ